MGHCTGQDRVKILFTGRLLGTTVVKLALQQHRIGGIVCPGDLAGQQKIVTGAVQMHIQTDIQAGHKQGLSGEGD